MSSKAGNSVPIILQIITLLLLGGIMLSQCKTQRVTTKVKVTSKPVIVTLGGSVKSNPTKPETKPTTHTMTVKADSGDVSLSLEVEYDELSDLFEWEAEIETRKDSVTVEKTVVVKDKPALCFIGGIRPVVSFKKGEKFIQDVEIDFGIRILGLYDLSLSAGVGNNYWLEKGMVKGKPEGNMGVRLGVKF